MKALIVKKQRSTLLLAIGCWLTAMAAFAETHLPPSLKSSEKDMVCGLVCPANIVVSTDPGSCIAVVNYTVTITDPGTCIGPLVQLTGLPSGVDFSVGTTVNSFEIEGPGGFENCSFSITVQDTELPVVLNCPADIAVNTDPGFCDAQVFWPLPNESDNCGVVSFTFTHSPGDIFPIGVTPVTYTATDPSGNNGICTFNVTVTDVESPAISSCTDPACVGTVPGCPFPVFVNNDPGLCSAVVTWDPVLVSDNCPGASLSFSHPSGSTFPTGFTTVTVTATDLVGNSTSCNFDVFVDDTEPPVLTCPDITINNDPGVCEATLNFTPTATDNCGIASYDLSPPLGSLIPVGTTNVSVTVFDNTGIPGFCSFNLTVVDAEAPVINNCPANITANNTAGLCGAIVNWTAPTPTDNCLLNSFTATHFPPDFFPIGTTTVTYTADDIFGNTSNCVFDITVVDNEPPVLTFCPVDVTVATGFGTCDASVVWLPPAFSDNCFAATLTSTHNPGDVFPLGNTTVTYTATDAVGNISTCSFIITVQDFEAPNILNCPADITAIADPGTCTATVNWVPPTATDNCGIASLTSTNSPGDLFPVGGPGAPFTVIYTATDNAGLVTNCFFNVTVLDNEAPVVTGCPADITTTTSAAFGICSGVVSWIDPVFTDNCGIGLTGSSHINGGFFPVGTTTVTIFADDFWGNTTTCVFDITLIDDEAPEIIPCPSNYIVDTDPGLCEAVVTWTPFTYFENCGVPIVTNSHNPGDAFPVGTTTVTYTATDASGNSSSCIFNVIVNDNEPPTISPCPANIAVISDPGLCGAAVFWALPNISDNCGIASQSSSHSPGDFFPLGTTTVVYTATDNAGLTVICSFDVTVADVENPNTTGCPANFGVSTDPGLCGANAIWAVPSATDNCSIASFTSNFNPGDFFPLGTTTVIYTATDNAGNSVSCSFDITVTDNENPVITDCPTSFAVANDPGNCSATASWPLPSATDNCGIASFTSNFSPGDVFPLGTTTVIYTATDNAGNSVPCSFDVTVTDNENPNFSNCPANISIPANTGNCEAIVTWTPPTPYDNCSIASQTSTHNPGDVFPSGTTTIIYSVSDNAGNSTLCSFDVTVLGSSSTVNLVESICDGNSYTVGNQTFTQTGNYQVVLIAANGCDSTVTLDLTVLPNSTTNLVETICEGNSYAVGNQSFSQTGNYQVVLNSSNGCDSTINLDLTVLQNSATNLTASICEGDSYLIGNQSFTQPGNYSVTLTAVNGCDSLINLDLTVFQNPNAMIFGPNSVCIGLGILLTTGVFDAYAWSPGGETTPSLPVTNGGTYGLTVTDGNGCTASTSTTIVEENCLDVIAAFSVSQDTVCASQFLQFSNQSSGNATSFVWNFGNGSFSNEQSPMAFYAAPGTYTVSLIASDGTDSDTTAQQVFVYPRPQAAFTVAVPEPCAPKSLIFNDNSTSSFGIEQWAWNFGDGSTGSGQSIQHSYTNFDTVNVTQVVTDHFGCVDSLNQNVVVADPGTTPSPVHLCLNLCAGDSLVVGNSVFNAANPIGSATLTAASGCDSTVTVELTFSPLQQSALMPDFSICENETTTLDAGSGSSFLWSNPMGASGATTQSITISQSGNYAVTVSNGSGCPVVKTVTVSVDNIPSVNAAAGADIAICETTEILALSAQPVAVATGLWTSLGNGSLNNPANPASTVSGLSIGENWFVWTLSNGACEGFSSDTVAVYVTAEVAELAQAGDDLSFCGSATAINLSAAAPQSAGVVGIWSQPNSQAQLGIQLLEPNNPNSPIEGYFPNNTYVFFWTLTNGVCGAYSVDNVLVSTYTSLLPPADAGQDVNLCDGIETSLSANLPANTTGEWTPLEAASTAFIAEPNEATTLAGDLAAGGNAFVWTLSSADCPAYSADTVVVFQSEGLAANADVYFNLGQPLTNLDFLANDKIPSADAVTLRFLSTPLYGSLTANADGSYDFQFGVDSTVNVEFTYEICLKDCPDLCAQAQVVILSKSPLPPPAIEKPKNVITPNGDGTGERMAIPNFGDIPPPIEITVINRWGNVVYYENDYQNDWDGRTSDGRRLPDGTYFYILKGAGSEVSGAVTVVR